MIVNKIGICQFNINININMILKKKKKKKGTFQFNKYEIYYEIYYVNSIACARYSQHCDGFSLYPHKKTRGRILMTLYSQQFDGDC